jgi:hypothetical protein
MFEKQSIKGEADKSGVEDRYTDVFLLGNPLVNVFCGWFIFDVKYFFRKFVKFTRQRRFSERVFKIGVGFLKNLFFVKIV